MKLEHEKLVAINHKKCSQTFCDFVVVYFASALNNYIKMQV